jgi:hypothetical protein
MRLTSSDLTEEEISNLTQDDPILQNLSWKKVDESSETGYTYQPIELDQKIVEALAKTNEGCTY